MGRTSTIPEAIKVQIIKEYERTGETARAIAQQFGVTESAVSNLLNVALVNIKSRVRMMKIVESAAHEYNPELELK